MTAREQPLWFLEAFLFDLDFLFFFCEISWKFLCTHPSKRPYGASSKKKEEKKEEDAREVRSIYLMY